MHNHKKVIRVEHADGYGMFWTKLNGEPREAIVKNLCHNIASKHYYFNTPYEDGLDLHKDGKEWFCAYKSIAKLKEMVEPEEVELLVRNGYKVYFLHVQEFQTGDDQVIYTKESIILKKDITVLFLTN